MSWLIFVLYIQLLLTMLFINTNKTVISTKHRNKIQKLKMQMPVSMTFVTRTYSIPVAQFGVPDVKLSIRVFYSFPTSRSLIESHRNKNRSNVVVEVFTDSKSCVVTFKQRQSKEIRQWKLCIVFNGQLYLTVNFSEIKF